MLIKLYAIRLLYMAAMLSVGLRVFRRCGDDTLLWIASDDGSPDLRHLLRA